MTFIYLNVVFFLLHIWRRPYLNDLGDLLEGMSLLMLVFISILVSSSVRSSLPTQGEIVLSVFVLVPFCVFAGLVLYYLYTTFLQRTGMEPLTHKKKEGDPTPDNPRPDDILGMVRHVLRQVVTSRRLTELEEAETDGDGEGGEGRLVREGEGEEKSKAPASPIASPVSPIASPVNTNRVSSAPLLQESKVVSEKQVEEKSLQQNPVEMQKDRLEKKVEMLSIDIQISSPQLKPDASDKSLAAQQPALLTTQSSTNQVSPPESPKYSIHQQIELVSRSSAPSSDSGGGQNSTST